ncbi:MAG: acyl-CoA dehydrogenase, partial [Halieaceae bacterium]|nr:acyl-CoA dehydrogenase [Halieaceae bacterium]
KMGVRGSATCVMNFDAATGFLVGEANMGLNYMFTMMNYERLGMGIQGVGAAQLSYQQAAAYAHDRLQGRAAGGARNTEKKADPIIVHADVRRMLLTMRSLTEAGRCFSLYVAKQLDIAKFSDEVAAKKRASALVALLTPVAKAFLTDMAYESCNLGQMILGGHGYIREWGQEQLVRDVRIAQIYEGTNGIQAMDLLGRKVVANSGAFLEIYCDEIRAFITAQEANEHTAAFLKPLADAVDKLEQVSEYIFAQVEDDPDIIGASAADYLAVVGHVSYAYMWALMLTASAQYQSDEAEAADDFCQSKNYVGQFYLQKILPRIDGLIQAIESGSDCIMTMPEELFN